MMIRIIKSIWAVFWGNDAVGIKKKEEKKYREKLKTDKELATKNNEPWVSIVSVDVDYAQLHNGSFELDWNDIFVARLIKFGYTGKTDADIVDQWFTEVCKNVVLETYQQSAADISNVRDLGDGKREYK